MTEEILNAVSDVMNVSRTELGIKTDGRDTLKLTEARQTAAFLLWKYTRLTTQQIATHLGYKKHSNVVMAKRRVIEIMGGNKEYKNTIESIEAKFLRK